MFLKSCQWVSESKTRIIRLKTEANHYPTTNKDHGEKSSFLNWSQRWLWRITGSELCAETGQRRSRTEKVVCAQAGESLLLCCFFSHHPSFFWFMHTNFHNLNASCLFSFYPLLYHTFYNTSICFPSFIHHIIWSLKQYRYSEKESGKPHPWLICELGKLPSHDRIDSI